MRATLIVLALLCTGCDLTVDSVVVDKTTGCEWAVELPKSKAGSKYQTLRVWMAPHMGADGKQICRAPAP